MILRQLLISHDKVSIMYVLALLNSTILWKLRQILNGTLMRSILGQNLILYFKNSIFDLIYVHSVHKCFSKFYIPFVKPCRSMSTGFIRIRFFFNSAIGPY